MPSTSSASLAQWPHFKDPQEVLRYLAPHEPVLCFSHSVLTASAEGFVRGFPGRVSYAVKANNHLPVLDALIASHITIFDVASLPEIQTVTSLCPKAVLHYHNPVKSRHEIKEAYHTFGCKRFAIDSLGELNKICDLIPVSSAVEIAVRLQVSKSLSCAHDFSSKFGAPFEETCALLQEVARRGFSPVLTFHPGSQCMDPEVYRLNIGHAARVIEQSGVPIHILNVGGGFPAQYHQGHAPSQEIFFRTIQEATQEAFASLPMPVLECEPGRGLVADCVSLLTRVTLVKPEKRELYLNDGIYGALMEMYQIPALTPRYRVWQNDALLTTPPTAPFVVFGPTCDPVDRLPGIFDLPLSISEGDYLEFATLGAYGDATSTHFNGYGTHRLVNIEHF